MGHGTHDPLLHPEVKLASAGSYGLAYVLSVLLMAGALFIATHPALLSSALVGLSVVAAVAVVIQLLLLFQLSFSETQMWTTISFILIVPLFVIAVGLTVWMFNSLDARTMMVGLMH